MKNGKMLKWLLTLACLLAALCAFTLAANAAIVDSGYCGAEGDGTNLKWTLDNAGTLTIKGKGQMTNYYYSAPWGGSVATAQQVKKLVLENGISNIGNYAFYGCKNLLSITIPNSVTNIGDSAFELCTGLTNVIISSRVTKIEEEAFCNCISLQTITIPKSVTTIENNTFSKCICLASVSIPDNVTEIGVGAFSNCPGITELTVSNKNAVYYSKGNCIIKRENKTLVVGCQNSVIPTDGSVSIIGCNAFDTCTGLNKISIPKSVTKIDNYAFFFCTGLKSVIIPNYVTSIGYCAFFNCTSLSDVTIPNSVINIESQAFDSCAALRSISLPSSISSIHNGTFEGCTSLKSITISDSITYIHKNAFYSCSSLTDVYYSGTSKQWDAIHLESGNDILKNATIHYNSQPPHDTEVQTGEATLQFNSGEDYYAYVGETVVYPVGSSAGWSVQAVFKPGASGYTGDDITWTCSDTSKLEITGKGSSPSADRSQYIINCHTHALTTGSVTLTASLPNGESKTINIEIVFPFEYSATYDSVQNYADGGFYSQTSGLSDCVEIYLSFKNKASKTLYAGLGDVFAPVHPVTIKAKVDGNDLSFDRDTYQNTYTYTTTEINAGKYVDDILMLFPYHFSIDKNPKNYTVEITVSSDSFDNFTETCSFSIEKILSSAEKHIEFVSSNTAYLSSKQNIYGKAMLELRNDNEYKWSKITSFDFDNYFQIVFADLMINMLNVRQTSMPDLLPKVLKDWVDTYETLLGGFDDMIEENYKEEYDLSETNLDKLFKKSKYETEGMKKEDDLRDKIVKLIGNKYADKVNTVFAKIDKTKQVYGFIKLGKDLLQDAIDWGNRLTVLNAYVEADNTFKGVIKQFADSLPTSQNKMKEAVYDYINYNGMTAEGYLEFLESMAELFKNVSLDAFNSTVGKSFQKYIGIKLVNWAGASIKIGGVALAKTTAFASAQTALGAVSTGITLGLCLSDVLCDSSGKTVEMSKTIYMSAFSPYIINTLNYYETQLRTKQTDNAVKEFEYAFALHKAAQSYIMEHTAKSCEVKADSIIIKLFSKDDWDGIIADTLAMKHQIDNLMCHRSFTSFEETIVSQTKVIFVQCPVDVSLFDEKGNEVVRIINNTTEHVVDGISVTITDTHKYIVVPANQDYKIEISAYDNGTMDYSVAEYDETINWIKTVKYNMIPLSKGEQFTGIIADTNEKPEEQYDLKTNNKTIKNSEIIEAQQQTYTPGDADGDGKLTSADARLALRASVGLTDKGDVEKDSAGYFACDVDGDGKVTSADARLILRASVGLEDASKFGKKA